MDKIKIGIFGPYGRMGKDLIKQIESFDSLKLSSLCEKKSHKHIGKTISNILIEEDKNHEVDMAENGLEGFEMLTQNTYDLVLCDIKMPKWMGWSY